MTNPKKSKRTIIFSLIAVLIFTGLLAGCGAGGPKKSQVLEMARKHHREMLNVDAYDFEIIPEGEVLDPVWDDNAGDYAERFAQPVWAYIDGDLPGQKLRVKLSTIWRKSGGWHYEGIAIYMINSTEQVKEPDEIPVPPQPPEGEELEALIRGYLEMKYPAEEDNSRDSVRMSLQIKDIEPLEEMVWTGPNEDFSYDTMKFTQKIRYSYDIVLMERGENVPQLHEVTVEATAAVSAFKPNGADWLTSSEVDEWKYYEDSDLRTVVEENVSDADIEIPELDKDEMAALIRNMLEEDGYTIQHLAFAEQKNILRQKWYQWKMTYAIRCTKPHWNGRDTYLYDGTVELQVNSNDMGATWDLENAQLSTDWSSDLQFGQ